MKMELPHNNRELAEIFKNARTPKISDFDGEYSVDMLTGLPNLRRFSHRKVFCYFTKKNKVFGHNLLFKEKRWGHFFLEEVDSLGVVVINYDRASNSFISSRIRDYVRSIEGTTLYLGRFNYLFMGKLHFLGWFSLSKIN